LPAVVQLSATPVDNNPEIFHDLPDVPQEILDDTAFMIALDPLRITADVAAKVLEGAESSYHSKIAKTFQDYVDVTFLPYIKRV
jgi:hypothetical protein